MWISFMILIIVVVLILAFSIDTKASKEEVGKLKEDIKLLTNSTKKFMENSDIYEEALIELDEEKQNNE